MMAGNNPHAKDIAAAGVPLPEATKAFIMLHGRGGTAADILSLAQYFPVQDYALLAPQATGNTWYPYSFLAPAAENEPWLSGALSLVDELIGELKSGGMASEDIYLLGFSQGACLMLESVCRQAEKFGGIIAFSGGLIGEELHRENYQGDFGGTPVFIGSSNPDMHVPVERVYATTRMLKEMHAKVTEKIYDHMGHTIIQDEINQANRLIFKTI